MLIFKYKQYFTTNIRLIEETTLFFFVSNMKYYMSRNKMARSADYCPIIVYNIKRVLWSRIVILCSKGKISESLHFFFYCMHGRLVVLRGNIPNGEHNCIWYECRYAHPYILWRWEKCASCSRLNCSISHWLPE